MNTDEEPIYAFIAGYDVEKVRTSINSRSDRMVSAASPLHVTPICAAFAALDAARSPRDKKAARQIISMLLEALKNKPDVINKCNANSMSPLMLAISCDAAEYVDQLVQLGADVNLLINGNTPLSFALAMRSSTAIPILLKHGASLDAVDMLGLMDLIIKREDREIIWLLEEKHSALLQALLMERNYVANAATKFRFRIALDLVLCTIPVLQGVRNRTFADRLFRGEREAWQTNGVPTDDEFCHFVMTLLLGNGDAVNAVNVLSCLSEMQVPGFQHAFRRSILIAARSGNIAFFKKLGDKELVATYVLQTLGGDLIGELLEEQSEELIVLLIEQGANPGLPRVGTWSAAETDFFSRACNLGKKKVVAAVLKGLSDDTRERMALYAVSTPLMYHILENDDLPMLKLLDCVHEGVRSTQDGVNACVSSMAPACTGYLLSWLPDQEMPSAMEQTLAFLAPQILKTTDIKRFTTSRKIILTLIEVLARKNVDVDRLAKKQLLYWSATPHIVHTLTSLGANPCELLKIGLRNGVEVSPACVKAAMQGLLAFVVLVDEFKLQAIKQLALELLHPLEELCDQLLKYEKEKTADDSVKELALELRQRLMEWRDIMLMDSPDPLSDQAFMATVSQNSPTQLRTMRILQSLEVTLFVKRWLSAGRSWPPVSLMGFLADFQLYLISSPPPLDDDVDKMSDTGMDVDD